jgi:hypothetical protein
MPPTTIVDHKLVLGSALFGLGWGIAGYCPGAAIAAIGSGSSAVLVFLGATGAGMALYRGFEHAAAPEPEPAAAE